MSSIDLIRNELLELHRILIEEERRDYERLNGKVTPGELLDLLVNHESFAWLRPFTKLLIELEDQEAAAVDRARGLLRPDPEGGVFQRRYDELVQRSAELGVAHGSAMRVLRTS